MRRQRGRTNDGNGERERERKKEKKRHGDGGSSKATTAHAVHGAETEETAGSLALSARIGWLVGGKEREKGTTKGNDDDERKGRKRELDE